MGKDALEKADQIIMDAYINGISIIGTGDNIVVKQRLRLFGEWIGNAYYLNERGIDYASNGCLKGIKAKIKRQEEIELLDIETKKFTKKKQKWTFRFAVISLVISLISILTQVGLLSKILQWISDLAQWICYILS